jgi:hypothetical protein
MTRLLEIDTTREKAQRFDLKGGRAWTGEVLRVRCRYAGDRRWRSFLLVPEKGQTVDELARLAEQAAERVLAEDR